MTGLWPVHIPAVCWQVTCNNYILTSEERQAFQTMFLFGCTAQHTYTQMRLNALLLHFIIDAIRYRYIDAIHYRYINAIHYR